VRSAHTAAGACWRGPVPGCGHREPAIDLAKQDPNGSHLAMLWPFFFPGRPRREAARVQWALTNGTELRCTASIAARRTRFGAQFRDPATMHLGVRLAATRSQPGRS